MDILSVDGRIILTYVLGKQDLGVWLVYRRVAGLWEYSTEYSGSIKVISPSTDLL